MFGQKSTSHMLFLWSNNGLKFDTKCNKVATLLIFSSNGFHWFLSFSWRNVLQSFGYLISGTLHSNVSSTLWCFFKLQCSLCSWIGYSFLRSMSFGSDWFLSLASGLKVVVIIITTTTTIDGFTLRWSTNLLCFWGLKITSSWL